MPGQTTLEVTVNASPQFSKAQRATDVKTFVIQHRLEASSTSCSERRAIPLMKCEL
jgi:hypothetical protein